MRFEVRWKFDSIGMEYPVLSEWKEPDYPDLKSVSRLFNGGLKKEHGCLPHDIARTLTTRRICLGHSISSILM